MEDRKKYTDIEKCFDNLWLGDCISIMVCYVMWENGIEITNSYRVDGIIHENDRKDWTTTNSGNIRKQKKMDLYVVKQAVAG